MNTEIPVRTNLLSDGWSDDKSKDHHISFSGYLYYEEALVQSANDLYLLAKQKADGNENIISWFKNELLPKSNGNFALVLITANRLFATTDLVRSRPLYITEQSDRFMISDRVNSAHENSLPEPAAMEQYITAGFTFGQITVYKHITSLRPGEWIEISKEGAERNRYFQFVYDNTIKNEKSNDVLAKKLDNILLRVFQRMVNSVPSNTQWVIPLSGGHDSRLVANYLYRLGIKNVLCYSYGTTGNKQSQISQKVAESLGYRWEFLESTEEEWHKLHKNGLFDDFIHFSFNGDSLPHLQDFLAVYKLKNNGDLEENAVFVPGHGIDFISDYVSEDHREFRNEKELSEAIKAKYCNLCKSTENVGSLLTSIADSVPHDTVPFGSLMEYFAWENRQAKFTANSMQVYEFYGYGWKIPFWEKEIVDFWLGIDCKRRTDQWFYRHANATRLLTEPLRKIPYANFIPVSRSIKDSESLKSIAIKVIPAALLSRIVRLLNLKTIDDEGSTLIYAKKAKDIEHLITPLDNWPDSLLPYIRPKIKRYTYQVNFHSLTALYTLNREVIQKKS